MASLAIGFALAFLGSTQTTRADYVSWKASYFNPTELANEAISGDDQDPDLDGMSNLLEYALASDPRVAETCLLPLVQVEENHLTLTHRFVPERTDVVYSLESSETLLGWVRHNNPLVLGSSAQDGYSLRTLQDALEISSGGKRFLRLSVALDPDSNGFLFLAPVSLTAGNPPVIPVQLQCRDRSNTEAGFLLQKKEGIAGDWEDLATIGPDTSSSIDSLAEAYHEYYYRVAALFATGTPSVFEFSDWSNELQGLPRWH